MKNLFMLTILAMVTALHAQADCGIETYQVTRILGAMAIGGGVQSYSITVTGVNASAGLQHKITFQNLSALSAHEKTMLKRLLALKNSSNYLTMALIQPATCESPVLRSSEIYAVVTSESPLFK